MLGLWISTLRSGVLYSAGIVSTAPKLKHSIAPGTTTCGMPVRTAASIRSHPGSKMPPFQWLSTSGSV